MLNIQNVGVYPTKQYNKIGFKAQNNATQGADTQDVSKEQDVSNEQDVYQKYVTEQQKRINKEERRKNISIGANVLLVAAFVTMAATSVYQLLKGRGKVAKTVFSKVGNMPSLADDCVNPDMRNFIGRVTKLFSKTSELTNYAGVKKRANMVLFHGPTGTGKTFSAKLLAKEMGAEYGEVQFSELSSAYIGVTAVNITKKFQELAKLAKKNPDKKYVVAFNEIDSLINNIDKLGSNNLHLGQNRTSFLNGLDSIKDIPNLTIVGTTNVNPHSANLDPATLSRLGEIFEIKHPSVTEIKAAFKYHLKDSQAAKDLIANDSELERIAQSVYDKKGVQRDVENIVNTTLEEFVSKIKDTSVKLTADDITNVINKKDTWAAAIGYENKIDEEVFAKFLEQENLLEKFWNFINGNKAA